MESLIEGCGLGEKGEKNKKGFIGSVHVQLINKKYSLAEVFIDILFKYIEYEYYQITIRQ